MKIFLAFVYFFGCILVIFGLLWLMIWVAPAEYVLDRSAIAQQGGKLQHPERLFPNFTSRDSYAFPGASAGLIAEDDKVRVWVIRSPCRFAQAMLCYLKFILRFGNGKSV